jgi:dihydrofolate synthase/folylpolyglutamate synthase
MTYREAIEFLYSLRLFGTKLGLENAFKLAELAGDPQKHLRFIHVAGTNGKGSTCAMLESIYRESGLRTGLFTSPHLVSFTERIQVNRTAIPATDVARLTKELIAKLGGADPESWSLRPTFFEFVTILALTYFLEQRCDLIIWETGLGGRLDATNIVVPLASVITNIQFDHQQWLGNSLRQIAGEKAGIIKESAPVITGIRSGEALEVIREAAERLHSPLHISPADLPPYLEKVELPLLGEHQRLNAALAVQTIDVLRGVIPVTEQQIRRGLESVAWPGRLQLVQVHGKDVLLDGAHNPDGARTVAAALHARFAGREFGLVLGLFKDKAWKEMCEVLVPLAKRIYLVPLANERSADPEAVGSFCAEHWPEASIQIANSAQEALTNALSLGFTVVAGSLHLIGEVMELLDIAPNLPSERELNEWDAGKKKAAGCFRD